MTPDRIKEIEGLAAYLEECQHSSLPSDAEERSFFDEQTSDAASALRQLLQERDKSQSAIRKLAQMCEAATSNGHVYVRGNPRPFEIMPDGHFAIDYFIIKEIADAMLAEQQLPVPHEEGEGK